VAVGHLGKLDCNQANGNLVVFGPLEQVNVLFPNRFVAILQYAGSKNNC